MEDNNLDLLDLDDTDSMDSLPEVNAFAAPRPKKPWLLLIVGVLVIVLATYIIVRAIGGESSSSIEVDLDAPVIAIDGAPVGAEMNVMPPVKPVQVQADKPVPPVVKPVEKPVVQPEVKKVEESAGIPVRVIEERKEVKFNPTKTEKPATKTVAPAPKQGGGKTATKPANKSAAKNVVNGGWYVQFGSYSSRALAESAQRKIQSQHQGLFAGKQFVILAAQLQNGTTTYRLRVAFANSNDANGFCRNAKADGLDCYVAR